MYKCRRFVCRGSDFRGRMKRASLANIFAVFQHHLGVRSDGLSNIRRHLQVQQQSDAPSQTPVVAKISGTTSIFLVEPVEQVPMEKENIGATVLRSIRELRRGLDRSSGDC